MRTREIDPELSLTRYIATASRDKDMKLTRLQAIDKLRELRGRFREQWIGPGPWLVLNGYALPNMDVVDEMLKKMEKYGDPVGMVGIAFLPRSRKIAVLKMLFRSKADARAVKIMENAANALEKNLPELIRPLDPLKGGGTE